MPVWKIRVVAVLACFVAAHASLGAEEEASYQRILDQTSPAIVTVKCVLKIKTARGEQEMESENSGVMIEPKGLVLCSNSRLGGAYGLVRRLMGSGAGSMTINPTQIKIIVGDMADGVDGKFVARDTELDLAWIQIKEPGDKPFAFIDLNRAAVPKVGQKLLSVYRTSKNYDRTAVVMESQVGGIVKKPRELYRAGELLPALGLPAFAFDGRIAGVSVLQIPESDDEAGAQNMALDRMANSHEYAGAILPIAEVVKATTRAKESADSQPAEEAGNESTSKPAGGEAKKKANDQKKESEEK